ncbi:MAG TPA: hypothetical protein PLU30_10155 [Verrucomicrobiae bacterium]|nr:hypothetical protein [Verrucomicrobiae bacterium]
MRTELRSVASGFARVAWFAGACALSAVGQQAPEPVADPGWPRVLAKDGNQVVIFQPQVDEWANSQLLRARMAVAVTAAGTQEKVYGAAKVEASTRTDFQNRTVLLGTRKVTELNFPGQAPERAAQLREIVMSALPPQRDLVVSLDRIIANLERTKLQEKDVAVNLEPPPILYSDKPAILVIFLGEPKFKPVEGTDLLFAANTNWDIFLEVGTGRYFLLNGESWLTTQDLQKGPWEPARQLPAGLAKLPDDPNWSEVKKHIPGTQAAAAPVVLVSQQPAELIVTDGQPAFAPIPNTKLLYVTNADNDLFLHSGEANYYFLAAGRWFRAKKLEGPWSAASKDLPADFAAIPENHAKADVLASVPHTPQAEEAVIQASIPRTATVKRNAIKLTVQYQGAPQFVAIPGTQVQFAKNTPNDVFLVGGGYYCCYQGVWFVAAAPTGPWAVCDKVPPAIYTIPPSSPKYNVTYVYVYDSQPETVTVGYTSGYTGAYVVGGAVMFGLGMWLGAELAHDWDDCHYYCGSVYFSYGCGVRYDYYHGGFYRAGYVYGPYGGAGRVAYYNPSTGTFARGAAVYGPYGSARFGEAYNPWTGNYAAHAGGSSIYGSWGRTYVETDDGWARMGHQSSPRGATAGFETSEGAKGVIHHSRITGDTGGIVKNDEGDIYAGKDGNLYRKEDGQWQKYDDGDWNDVNPPPKKGEDARQQQKQTAQDRAQGTGRDQIAQAREARTGQQTDAPRAQAANRETPRAQAVSQPSVDRSQFGQGGADFSGGGITSQLNRESYSRQRGSQRAAEFQRSGGADRPFGGGGGGGGAGRRRR